MNKKITTLTDVKSFVIDRKKWFRGKGQDFSSLRVDYGRDKGKMCCLGSYALACGLEPNQIDGVAEPRELVISGITGELPRWKTKLVAEKKSHHDTDNTSTCWSMMGVNDDENINDRKRESELKKLFAKIGVKVKFKG